MPVNFPNSPSNDDEHSANGLVYKYNSAKGAWKRKFVAPTDATDINQLNDSSGLLTSSSTTIVADMAALIALTGMSSGDQAYITANNKLYFYNGSGWYLIATVQNDSPSAITGVAGGYALAIDGTATTITAASTDPEGFPLSWSYSTSGLGNIATVSNTDNVFTITPSTTEADAGTFTLTINATDGINGAVSTSTNLTLNFIITVTNSNYTTLLATAVDTSDNNNITDSSTNNHTPTLINPTDALAQGSFNPYRSGGYSTSFDGTTNTYLNVSSSSGGAALGSGDFTISFWVYPNDPISGGQFLLDYRPLGNNSGFYPTIYMQSGTFVYKFANVDHITGNTLISSKQWSYFCLARDNGVTRMYINGTLQTQTYSGIENLTNGTNRPVIGTGAYSITPMFNGYISDLRVVTSLDTTAYSVPTGRMSAISNTQLLTCHLPYIADGSTNAHTITVNGDVSTKPFSPFDYVEYSATDHGGSIQSTNSDDTSAGRTGLSFADHADFDLAGSDWTFEWWAYVPKSEGVNNHNFIQKGPFGAIRPYTVIYRLESGQPGWEPRMFGSSDGSSQWQGYSGSAWQPWSIWTHVAFVRNGSTITRYINGKAYGTGSGDVFDNNEVLYVGGGYGDEQPHTYSDLRISKSAVYTAEFTPPTAPLSSSGSVLHLKGANASIVDKSQTTNLKLVGNTTGSTTQVKFANTKSMYFDGSGDYIDTNKNLQGDFGTGDFTVEGWFYLNEAIGAVRVLLGSGTGDGNDEFMLVLESNGKLTYDWFSVSDYIQSTSTITAYTWHHIALTRSGTQLDLWLDGTSVASNSSHSHNYNGTSTFKIGMSRAGAFFWNGYIQDVRISNGLARYTANFTPPTASLEG